MQCSIPNCPETVSHSFGFPGLPVQFICEAHRDGASSAVNNDHTQIAHFQPIADFVDDSTPAAALCTHKAHNTRHVRAAVLAYAFPTIENRDDIAPGLACPACVIEIVNVATRTAWPLELSELP
jgi:hypothetical protein